MKPFAIRREEQHRDLSGRILCQDVRGVFRKGHVLREDDIPLLMDASWTELHLIELGPDDIAQREAGLRLAQILSSDGLQVAPAGHRHVLKAKHKGLLKIDAAALQRINGIHGIAVFTLMNDAVVSEDQVVVEAQITPLAIERGAIEKAAQGKSIVQLRPFVPHEVILFTRDAREVPGLKKKLAWFGCHVHDPVDLTQCGRGLQPAVLRLKPARTLVLISGSNALDPLDPVFVTLEQLGAKMQRVGLPVHPGTLLWIASWNGTTIIGLPSCGLGPQVTGFDLVLPKILAEGGIRDDELALLGHGGILRPVIANRPPVIPSREDPPVIPSREDGEESGRGELTTTKTPTLRDSE
jgi:hypothetical protein